MCRLEEQIILGFWPFVSDGIWQLFSQTCLDKLEWPGAMGHLTSQYRLSNSIGMGFRFNQDI